MIALASRLRVYLAGGVTELRKGICAPSRLGRTCFRKLLGPILRQSGQQAANAGVCALSTASQEPILCG
jgi:hypothetical protein